MAETLLNAGRSGCEKSKSCLTQGQHLWCVSERMCFAMNFHCRRSGLHYLPSIRAHGRKSVSAEKQQINFDFNSMCNTQNTCLLSFHLRFSRTRSLTVFSCLQSCYSEMKILSQKCWLFWICPSCARYDGFIVTFWYGCWLKVWSGKYSLFEMCSYSWTAIRIIWRRQKKILAQGPLISFFQLSTASHNSYSCFMLVLYDIVMK